MADEEVMGSASPAPSDHKRKLEDLDSEPLEQPPVSAESNGNSQTMTDADGDGDADAAGVSTEDPDAKRPRLDDERDGFVESTENGHEEENTEEAKEEMNEPATVMKNTESEEDQEKTSEPLEAVNKEFVPEDHEEEDLPNARELNSTENPEESNKEENQESGVEEQDPSSDVAPQEDLSGLKDHSMSDDLPRSTERPTSRRMEVPSNKVGVLIGKSGDTIRTLQNSSGARIQITRDSEADPNAATRPVDLIGSIESINKAERLIKEVIAEADAGGSPSLIARGFSAHSSGIGEQIQIQVPNEKVGVIIGKGGETIKNLQTRSGARIQLIPQHLPEGDQSKERTVRVTGDRKQIEIAKEMIKEVMEQPIRSSTSSGGHNQQNFRGRGSGGGHWGPRGGHSSHSTGYNHPPRGGPAYPSQNPPYSSQYSSQGYGNYPPQQPPPKNNYGWEQRPPANMQGPPEPTGYDYYGGQGASTGPPPMHSHGPGPAMGPPPSQGNYNYGQPQGPEYGQHPAPYTQTAPQGYGQGYGEPRYDQQGPGQHPYVGQGTQPPTYPQGGPTTHPGYGQQDQYAKPPAYNMPPQGHYGQPYGQPPRQQPYPVSTGPVQQGYPQYGTAPAPAPAVNDGYGHSAAATGGYGQPGGQPVSGYGPTGGQQVAPGYGQTGPTTGYGQTGPTTGYGQYPSTQPGYTEQAAPNSSGYGYQGPSDPVYGGGPGMAYGAPPPVQAGYSQPASVQPGYDQSIPQSGGYVAPQPQPQPQPQVQPQAGYGQYDSSQMYAAHR